MPVKKRTPKVYRHRLTPEAVEAWRRCDYHGLANAFHLAPWQHSPLPRTICELGVDQDSEPHGSIMDESLELVKELQRELIAVAGMPDKDAIRVEYDKKLRDAESRLDWELNGVRPEPTNEHERKWRASSLEDAKADLSYRKRLLEELDAA